MRRRLLVLLISASLVACANGRKSEWGDSVADIKPVEVKPQAQPQTIAVNLDELIQRYRDVMAVAQDPAIIEKVSVRLAHLEMMASERRQISTDSPEALKAEASSFQSVVTNYEELLVRYPENKNNDQILYQLAKAYDLMGNRERSLATLDRLVQEYPTSSHVVEVEFRRGEIFFAEKNWKDAESAYEVVIRDGADSKYFLTAQYMHGWVLFNRGDYDLAEQDFAKVLDKTLGDKPDLSAVSQTQLPLVEDSLKVLSLMFGYTDGGKSIVNLFATIGDRPYAPLLYDRLGQSFVDQERYQDAAEAYRTYIDVYPDSAQAPLFQRKIIDAYAKGNFPTQILPEKERFVREYGVTGKHWSTYSEATKASLQPLVQADLQELAAFYHAKAQALRSDAAGKGGAAALADSRKAFDSAAYWYEEFVKSFPDHASIADKVFLRGEALYEAGRYREALVPYEQVAYQLKGHPKAAEAGYASVVIFDKLSAVESSPEERKGLQEHKIAAEMRFAQAFPADARALPAQLNAAEQLLQQGRFPDAIAAATVVTDWKPSAPQESLITAWTIIGHSHFDTANFVHAEEAYLNAMKLLPEGDKRRLDMRERIAAAIYKQGEVFASVSEKRSAAEQFLRVGQVVPDASIRVNADYDAATYYIQLQDWPLAVQTLTDFRKRYPKHKFSADIPAKLAYAYQEMQQWDKAAGELRSVSENEADPNAKQQALYLSAGLYEKSGDQHKAAEAYRNYLSRYPEPFDLAMEARAKLAEYHMKINDPTKRRYWLQEIVVANDRAGAKVTERSRYLAAMATSIFAGEQREQFSRIKLTAPLSRSLKQKQDALQKTLAAYEKSSSYGVQEFATEAAYQVGEVYAQLSRDLMNSDRPSELGAEELEQYDLLLEEQAYPFEENAISIHEANIQRVQNGTYDKWVKASYEALAKLLPARYNKTEEQVLIHDSVQ